MNAAPPRIAVVLTRHTEAEFVAAVELLTRTSTGAQVVVPALDAAATGRRVESLLGSTEAVTVEPIHTYLQRGHDYALLAQRDAADRGRTFAAAVVALTRGTPPDGTVLPIDVAAVLAESQVLDLPDEIRADLDWTPPGVGIGDGYVLVRTPWGTPMLALARDREITPVFALRGVYDPAVVGYLEGLLRPGDVAVDVGANIGLFTVLMAQLVGPDGRVYAYESDPVRHAVLIENLRFNNLNERATTRVLVTGLDDELAAVGSLTLVKVDLDGAECDILEALTRTIAAGRVRNIAIPLLREAAGADWGRLETILRRLRDERGATIALLDGAGTPAPADLEEVIAVGRYPQVVIAFPHAS